MSSLLKPQPGGTRSSGLLRRGARVRSPAPSSEEAGLSGMLGAPAASATAGDGEGWAIDGDAGEGRDSDKMIA